MNDRTKNGRCMALLCLLFAMLLALSACGSAKVASKSENIGNLTWSWDQGAKKLTISGNGAMEDLPQAADVPWREMRSLAEELVVEEGVTSIGDYAFYSMRSLQNVSLPSTLREIGVSSFAFCSSLTAITLPDGLERIEARAFEGCEGMKSVYLPTALLSVEKNAFAYCYSIKSVIAMGMRTTIADGVFLNCRSISQLLFHSAITDEMISDSAFEGTEASFSDIRRSDRPLGSTSLTIEYLLDGTEIDRFQQVYSYGAEYSISSPEREGYSAQPAVIAGVADGAPRQETVVYVVEEAPQASISSVGIVASVAMLSLLAGIAVVIFLTVRSDKGSRSRLRRIRRGNEK